MPSAGLSTTWSNSECRPLIRPSRRHVHKTGNIEATRKAAIDSRADYFWGEENEGKPHPRRSFANALAGGLASTPPSLLEIISSSHRRPLAMADKSFLLA
jgi:hypothetical protein